MTAAASGVDHVVLSVRDLDAAGAFLGRAGFTVTPRADLPFGTSNRFVLLDGNFIDLLATTSPEKIPPHRPERYSLGAQHQEMLARREGLSFVAMISDDARRDREKFIAGGLTAAEAIDVSRLAPQPDGTEARIAFTMVVVADSRLGDAQHFIYQIRTPDTFWPPAFQVHANGATEISEVVLVADEPAELAAYYSALVSPAAVHRVGNRVHVDTSKGRIVVLPPAELVQRFAGVDITVDDVRPYVAGFQVRSRGLDRVSAALDAGAITHVRRGDAIRLDPQQAFGAAIEFVAE